MQSTIKHLCFILILCSNQVFFAQNVTVIANEKLNVLYMGLDNPVGIAMEKVPADKLNVSISEGHSIEKREDGLYNVRVNRSGKVTIFVEGNGATAQKEFRVKPIPDPRPSLNVYSAVNGVLKMSEAKNVEYLVAPIVNFDIDAKCIVEGFSMVIKHSNGASEIYENKGPRFSAEILKVFGSVKENDFIMFYDISTRCPGDPVARKVQGISFVIK
jgi:GldM C-terminal domain